MLPLALAIVAIPITARALGPVRFGLLGLAWALLEYLGFVELGLGRTSVRFVAQSLTRSATELRQTVAIAVSSQAVLGLLGGAVLAGSTPWLVTAVFDVPSDAQREAAAMLYAVAANVVVVVLIGALRGVLEGAQRFGLSTAVKVPTAAAAVLIPAVGAVLGASLAQIMWLVLVVRGGAVALLLFGLPRVIYGFRWEIPREWRRLRILFAYSGWVAVSGAINPILASFDRFALSAFVGVAALGLYAAPYEGAVRLLLIPFSVFAALFPALSAAFTRLDGNGRSTRLLESVLRQLLLVLAPVVIILFALAPEVLQLWLGDYFAPEMSTAFRILLVGVLVNGLAHVPSVFLYAVGRPDVPAKIHIFELVLHVPVTIALVSALGITGAALAWTLRVVLDGTLLSAFAVRSGARGWWGGIGARWVASLAAVVSWGLAAALATWVLDASFWLALLVLGGGGAALAAVGWRRGLSGEERTAWLSLLPRAQGRSQRSS